MPDDEKHAIVFRNGPSGRRAALAAGPDVWEVVFVAHQLGAAGKPAVGKIAAELTLAEADVRIALAYYADHKDEVDVEIAENQRAAKRGMSEWLRPSRR